MITQDEGTSTLNTQTFYSPVDNHRIAVRLKTHQDVVLPHSYHHLLTGVLYGIIGGYDADYAKALHDDKGMKTYTFSQLRGKNVPARRESIVLEAGFLTWSFSSPLSDIVNSLKIGLMLTNTLKIGENTLYIAEVEEKPNPQFREGWGRFICLSPIIARDKRPDGTTHYLTPQDARFGNIIEANLRAKFRALTGRENTGDFALRFDADYLSRHRGTKLIEYKTVSLKGAFAPFIMAADPEMLEIGYASGLGSSNALGFGMIERA